MKSRATFSPVSEVSPDRSWHLHQLQALHDRLLHSRTLQAAAILETAESHPADFGDRASDDSDEGMTLSILTAEEDALYELEAAMRRIAEGDYGVCEETGEAIPEDRLRALPWTRYTREAAARLERRPIGPSPLPDLAKGKKDCSVADQKSDAQVTEQVSDAKSPHTPCRA